MRVSSYQGRAGSPERAKAIAAVVAVHAALAFVILSGLSVKKVSQAALERTTTILIRRLPPPPAPRAERPRPRARPQAAKRRDGAAAKATNPTPIVAPRPKLPLPSPIVAAKAAGTGSTTNSGASLTGNAAGSGGSGRASGAAGNADYSHFTPARLVSNIPNSQYARLAATGIPSGAVGVTILVNPNGSVSNCRIARSSGDPSIDALACDLTQSYVRFDPARDPQGRAVAQDITYFPSWRRR